MKKYTQDEIFQLNRAIGGKLDELISYFQIDLEKKGKMYVGKCPIHGNADNGSSFNLYHTGDIIGNWYCRTHQCEKLFKPTLIGLIRGILSHNNGWRSLKDKDKMYGFVKTLEFAEKFLGGNYEKLDNREIEKVKFANIFKQYERNGHTKHSRTYLRTKLKIPAQYYINRGYSAEILDKYDVGLCDDSTKPFYNKIVIPIFDDDYNCIVGYTARSIFNECKKCGSYHKPNEQCPQESYRWQYAKWINSKGFHKQEYLYNYWFAKDEIKKTGKVVLVEGPGDVLKMVQAGILNVVGLFGTVLTDLQKFVLDCSGAQTIITVMDNDLPGELASKEIINKCNKLYDIRKFDWKNSENGEFSEFGDIGEIPIKMLQEKKYVFVN